MEDDNCSNDFNKDMDDSVSPSSSSTRNDEMEETRASTLGHELRLDDSMDDFDIPKRLSLNGDGEQWLHIHDSPDPRVEGYIEKQTTTAASQNSSEEDEKKEGHISSPWKNDTEKISQAQTTFEAILQTQEHSPSQKTLTEMYTQMQTQLQTQTQETITQQSMPMSLLEYLNQPTQDDNETATINVGIGSSIKILSGEELSTWNSGSRSLPTSSHYPPSGSAFLCFEKVTLLGEAPKSFMTVKDMRLPKSVSNSRNTLEEEIDLLTVNGDVSDEWKPLSRRKLTVLHPGDRIRIRTKASDALKTAVSIDPDISLLRNTLVSFTYKQTKKSIKNTSNAQISEKTNFDAEVGGETDVNVDMHVDDESQQAMNDPIPKNKTLESWDKGPNNFVGTTKKERAKKIPQAGDVISPRSISSAVIDSSLSIGIDSTVNTQQESLRSSRMNLLNRKSL